MHPGPPKAAEAFVGILIPPACREEVLGDLRERYRSPTHYAVEVLSTVPLVILSRIRRTADLQVILIQVFVCYVSFLVAAWFIDPSLLRRQFELWRLAIPPATAIVGLLFEDAYASPPLRSPLKLVRGPAVGLGVALIVQGILWTTHPILAIPRSVAFLGCATSLLLSSSVRLLFPPFTNQLQGANAPTFWLKQATAPSVLPNGLTLILKCVAILVTIAAAGTWIAERFLLPKLEVVAVPLVALIAYQLLKRG
ncbi:MAG: hypothetical protein WA324_23830 [Bryobacteraceae bacterium]